MFFLYAKWSIGLLGLNNVKFDASISRPAIGAEVETGKRFFLKDSLWFIEPVLNLSMHVSSNINTGNVREVWALQNYAIFGKSVRIRKNPSKFISFYGMAGVGTYFCFFYRNFPPYLHSILGMTFTFRIEKHSSLLLRIVHKYDLMVRTGYSSGHMISLLFGIEWHPKEFYNESKA